MHGLMLVVALQRRAGAKGFGLFTKQDLFEGDFLIEYVGEASTPALLQCVLEQFLCSDTADSQSFEELLLCSCDANRPG